MCGKSLLLGTANVEHVYGSEGPVTFESFRSILQMCNSGVNMLDLGVSYPSFSRFAQAIALENENVFEKPLTYQLKGLYLADFSRRGFNPINNFDWLLGKKCVKRFLVHDPAILRNKHYLANCKEWLRSCLNSHLDLEIGFSIYDRSDLDIVLSELSEVRIIQAPINICTAPDFLSELKKASSLGITIQARSIFLQGFLTSEIRKEELVHKTNEAIALLRDSVRLLSAQCSVRAESLLLSLVLALPFVDEIVIGVNTISQLTQVQSIFTDFNSGQLDEVLVLAEELRSSLESSFDFYSFDPRNW